MPPKRRAKDVGRATCPSEEDNPEPSTATSNQSWKLKFNERQLERKRQADRITQRRMREQSKQTAAVFQEKLNLLMDGDYKALMERTLAENEALVAKLNTFRAKFEHIYSASKECLGLEEEPGRPGNPVSSATSTGNIPYSLVPSSRLAAPSGSNHDAPIVEPRNNLCRTFAKSPSIFLPISDMFRNSEGSEIPTNHFTEAIMAWKYSMGLNDGLQFLTERLDAQGYAGNDVLHDKILSWDFYQRLLGLLMGNDVIRRKTAYLAYRIVAPWRSCYWSHAEMIAIFWTQFRHLLLFVFPSSENFARCPCWYRPMPTRLLHDHPGYLDFIIWPRLRERLTMTWKQHDMEILIRDLIHGFRVRTAGITPDQPLIRVKPNSNDLELSDEFEMALSDVSNFSMQVNFIARYPDLAPYIHADVRSFVPTLPSSTSVLLHTPAPQPSQLAVNQAFVPDTTWSHLRLLSPAIVQDSPNPLLSSSYLYHPEGYRNGEMVVYPDPTAPTTAGNKDSHPLSTHSSMGFLSDAANAETLDLSRSIPIFNPPVIDSLSNPSTGASLDLDSWHLFGGADMVQIPH
ncbi:hypothetical protein ABOM_001528 [Aspergillus bombycis]|uniref:BZIP transcription factor n=1 Tax=Aspergillus bombycis TaxID=109264 RepID=A0A1F8AF02_9EURO|nr:hypothetical protein ABOM_001528 [Aspergillus bombycis]OGM49898.1 hypothetical protein ABOM_001528 [Aspergillus bombycis]